jgi:acetyltransferase
MLHCTMTMIRSVSARGFRPDHLFNPTSVAVIGAATETGKLVLGNLGGGGFAGPILSAETADDVANLTMAPDLAVVATPPEQVVPAIAALGRRGGRAAVVTTWAPGLAAALAGGEVRVLGPGSFGVASPHHGLNATIAHLEPPQGQVALVSQSAALCRAAVDWAGPNGVGFSHIIGIGGNADIGYGIVLDWLSQDPGTRLVLLDIRRIKNRRSFLSAARACARLRSVVAIRAGGRLLDAAGGAEAVFEAALHRAGVLTVEGLEDLFAAAGTLTRGRPPRTDALAIVTNAIGPGYMAADAALRQGLALAPLAPATRAVLDLALPEGATNPGPVYVGPDKPMRLADAASMLGGAPEVGGVLIVHAPVGPADAPAMAALAAGAAAIHAPLLACAMGETTAAAHRRSLAAAGLPVFASPEPAVRGFLHLVRQRRARAAAQELPPSTVLAMAPDRAQVRALFARLRREGRRELSSEEALSLLSAYGVPVMPGRAVATAEDAVHAARLLGFPAGIRLGRSETGAADAPDPAYDLADADEVRHAATTMLARHRRAWLGAPDPVLLVQRQVGRARALRVVVTDDPVFGPAIGFGLGDLPADLLRELAWDLPPLNLPLAHALLGRTPIGTLLKRNGGQEPRSENGPGHGNEGMAETLVRISQLIVDFPEIDAFTLDPLFVDAEGVLATDAKARLRPPGEAGFLAIPPYPAELTERFVAGGEALVIRPIRPEDAAAHQAFFARLSPEDIRYRFFSSLRALSPELVARMTQVDYQREMAFIAAREANGDTVGVARLIREPGTETGEFAVIVQPDMKGRGIASKLMQRIIDWARDQGVTTVIGQILADNRPMLAFIRNLGFETQLMPEDPGVVEAHLSLLPETVAE